MRILLTSVHNFAYKDSDHRCPCMLLVIFMPLVLVFSSNIGDVWVCLFGSARTRTTCLWGIMLTVATTLLKLLLWVSVYFLPAGLAPNWKPFIEIIQQNNGVKIPNENKGLSTCYPDQTNPPWTQKEPSIVDVVTKVSAIVVFLSACNSISVDDLDGRCPTSIRPKTLHWMFSCQGSVLVGHQIWLVGLSWPEVMGRSIA
jgi:hypothetical protein